jgi:glutamate transport system permease protein
MSASVLYETPGPATVRRHRLYGVVSALALAALLGLLAWRLATKGQFDADKWEVFSDPDVLEALIVDGLVTTLKAAVVAVLLALLLGLLLAAMRHSDKVWLNLPAGLFIEFFRAIPLLLLILFIFLGYGDTIGQFWSLVIALMLYNGSVLAEIFRAGLDSVPRGQSEAAYAIGMRKGQVLRLILVPQAVRIMLPAIISQSVVALKDTALGFVIANEDLLTIGKRIYVQEQNPLQVAIVLAAIFIIICYALSRLAVYIEARQRRVRVTSATEGDTGPTLPGSALGTGGGAA